jgi:hypothetical protein
MRIAFCVVAVFVVMTCTYSPTDSREVRSERPEKIELARWILGSWQSQSFDAINYEIWKQIDDTTFAGRSYSIKNGDTVSSEFIKLVQRDAELAFIPTVPDQNLGVPIEFKLTFMGDDKMIFENAVHDFPQVITYEHVSTDSLVAEISGEVNGEHQAIQFPMRRFK